MRSTAPEVARIERQEERLLRHIAKQLTGFCSWMEEMALPPPRAAKLERLRRDVHAAAAALERVAAYRRRRRRLGRLGDRLEEWGPGNARLAGALIEWRGEAFEVRRTRRQLRARAARCVAFVEECDDGGDLLPAVAARLVRAIGESVAAYDLFLREGLDGDELLARLK